MAFLGGNYNTANVYSSYYDNLNRLEKVYQAGPTGYVALKQVYFSWDGLDRLYDIYRYEYHTGLGWKAAVEDIFTYDHDSRMTGLTHYLRNTSNRPIYTWTYDRASRPTAFTSSLENSGSGGSASYTYDGTSQLVGADYNGYVTDEAHSYDANGNRTNTGYTTGDDNRLTSDGVYDYEYDAEGNRTKRTRISDGAVTDYTWDYRNRLTSVTERASAEGPATKVVEYKYDVENRLVGKTLDPDGAGEESASEEYFAYDGSSPRPSAGEGQGVRADQVLFHFTGPNLSDLADRYLWAPAVDLLLSDEKLTGPTTPGDIYWALGDNLNTVRDIAHYDPQTDITSVANHRVYDAFGNLTSETNSAVDLLFSFTGRQFDAATGLQNNLNRWYDPKAGRLHHKSLSE